jgi:gentisate 1,2-dioxygenase
MTLATGGLLPYMAFRNELKARTTSATVWPWHEIAGAAIEGRKGDQPNLALLALSRTGALEGCEVVPGLSLSVQSLGPGASTPLHDHSWWHIYLVQAGSGVIISGEEKSSRTLVANDVVFIPGWCLHALRNESDGPFVTLNVSNIAEQANLANFLPG